MVTKIICNKDGRIHKVMLWFSKRGPITKSCVILVNIFKWTDYEHLLKNSNRPSIGESLQQEVFKTLNDLSSNCDDSRKKLLVKTQNTKQYGTNTLRSLGQQIWNSLSSKIKMQKIQIFSGNWSKPGQDLSVVAILVQMSSYRLIHQMLDKMEPS